MKRLGKLFWLLLIPTAIMADPVRFKSAKDAVDCNFVLSEPKSGLNWLAWCLQNLTRRSICKVSFQKGETNNPLSLELDETKTPLLCTHIVDRLRVVDPTRNRLILNYRNYKENTIRWCADPAAQYRKKLNKGTLFDRQARNLRFYDSWPEENRYIVHYEDMMENLEETLRGILDFLGESDEGLEEFLANIDWHRAQCLATYEANMKKFKQSGPISRGKATNYHSKRVPQELLLQADTLFKTKYPYLWEKYLTRYSSEKMKKIKGSKI